jgi:uncharacterized membrane protein
LRQHSLMQIQCVDVTKLKLLGILALATLLRFFGLGVKQLWIDEILQVIHSRSDSLQGILAGVAQDRGAAPLDYLIQHFTIGSLGGDIQWTARIHAAMFGVLAVLLIYLVCQELLNNQRLSLMCALLFCFYPFHHHYSQEGRPYSLFLLLTLWLYFLLLRLMKRNKLSTWGWYVIAAIMIFYAHAYASLVLFGQLLFLVYHQILKREKWRIAMGRGICFLFSGALAAAAYLPWLLYTFPEAKGDAPPVINIRLFLQMIKELGDGSYPFALVLLICAFIGIHSLIQKQRSLELGMLLIWLLTPIPVILIILSWREYFFATRQLIFITPAIFILAAVGVDFIKKNIGHKYFSPELVLILMSVVIIALHYPDRRDDLLSAGHFLKNNTQLHDVIISPNLTGVLSFYFPDIHNYAVSEYSIKDLAVARDISRIFYVDSRFNDDRASFNNLLSSMPQQKQIKFRGITIYIF